MTLTIRDWLELPELVLAVPNKDLNLKPYYGYIYFQDSKHLEIVSLINNITQDSYGTNLMTGGSGYNFIGENVLVAKGSAFFKMKAVAFKKPIDIPEEYLEQIATAVCMARNISRSKFGKVNIIGWEVNTFGSVYLPEKHKPTDEQIKKIKEEGSCDCDACLKEQRFKKSKTTRKAYYSPIFFTKEQIDLISKAYNDEQELNILLKEVRNIYSRKYQELFGNVRAVLDPELKMKQCPHCFSPVVNLDKKNVIDGGNNVCSLYPHIHQVYKKAEEEEKVEKVKEEIRLKISMPFSIEAPLTTDTLWDAIAHSSAYTFTDGSNLRGHFYKSFEKGGDFIVPNIMPDCLGSLNKIFAKWTDAEITYQSNISDKKIEIKTEPKAGVQVKKPKMDSDFVWKLFDVATKSSTTNTSSTLIFADDKTLKF